eukprot:TRINITY_DN28190_c0_g1_i1.p1 TRINITY_DN28190_c0_g1~~TRINITY_DN28190_c0_g1_i1.p1  ORF type:complete len:315 (+),score=61.50 TRINITY_DN28190_c0_g1_i1:70-1014(+)
MSLDSPRAVSPKTRSQPPTPCTPCRAPRRTTTPPPLQKRKRGILPAILKDSLEAVEAALQDDMLAAIMPVAFNWGSATESPLCVALQMGASAEIVELLLKHDADPNQCDSAGWTPLKMVAASRPLFEHDDNDNQCRLRADTWCAVPPPMAAAASSSAAPQEVPCFEERLDSVASPPRPRADTCPGSVPFNMPWLSPFDPFVGRDGLLMDLFTFPPNIISSACRPAESAGYATHLLGSIAEAEEVFPQPQLQQQRQRCRMSEQRCLQLTEVLLKYRADPFVRDADGLTAADHAANNERESLVALLRSGGRVMNRF